MLHDIFLFSKRKNSEQLNTRSWTFDDDNPKKNKKHTKQAEGLKGRRRGSEEEQKF